MSYCPVHGAEDVPGCVECEENPVERRAREDLERAERDLSFQSAPTNLAVPPDENVPAAPAVEDDLPQALASNEELDVGAGKKARKK